MIIASLPKQRYAPAANDRHSESHVQHTATKHYKYILSFASFQWSITTMSTYFVRSQYKYFLLVRGIALRPTAPPPQKKIKQSKVRKQETINIRAQFSAKFFFNAFHTVPRHIQGTADIFWFYKGKSCS